MDGEAWWAAVHGVSKSWTRLNDFTFTFHFHALEKELATHSSVLAWRIPGTGEPGGLPSIWKLAFVIMQVISTVLQFHRYNMHFPSLNTGGNDCSLEESN